MNERDDYEMQENAAIGQVIAGYLQAIMRDNGATTLDELQWRAYKDTAAGVSVGFRLHDGSYLWNGDERARDPAMTAHVAAIGVGSIVEDSDTEVPPEWLDFEVCNREERTDEHVVELYDQLLQRIDDAACALWDEENELNQGDDE